MHGCALTDGHTHVWSGPPLTEWHSCEACEGTGRDPDAASALDDVFFPCCLECGGEGGEPIEVAATCSVCCVSAIDVAWMEGV